MTTMERIETRGAVALPCPDLVPVSRAHAETCAACATCGAVTRFLEHRLSGVRGGLAAARQPANA